VKDPASLPATLFLELPSINPDERNNFPSLFHHLSNLYEHPVHLLKGKGRGKAVPLQAWSCPEGSRKLRFPDFMTTAQDVGKVVSLTHRPPLLPGNAPGTHYR